MILAARGPAAPTVAEPAATWIIQILLVFVQRHGYTWLEILFAYTIIAFRTNAFRLILYNIRSDALSKAIGWMWEHTKVPTKCGLCRFEKLWVWHGHTELRFYRCSYWDPCVQKQLIVQSIFVLFSFDLRLRVWKRWTISPTRAVRKTEVLAR